VSITGNPLLWRVWLQAGILDEEWIDHRTDGVGNRHCCSRPARAARESEEAPAVKNEGAKKPRVICRREAVAGSHMRKRICRTERELEIERQEAERMRDSDNTLRELPTEN